MSELGAIDCDVHPSVPDINALLPYLDTFWRDSVVDRGLSSLDSNSYPLKSPLTARPEWRGKHGLAAVDAKQVAEDVKARFGVKTVLINHVGPVIGAHSGPGTVALFFLGAHR